MPLRPLRCDHCGSTRLKYLRVGVDDEVAVCGLCHGVTEFPDEVTSEQANEDLVTHLERLRQRRPALEEGVETSQPRRRRGSSVLLWLMVALAAVSALGLFAGRELFTRPGARDRLDDDRVLSEVPRARGVPARPRRSRRGESARGDAMAPPPEEPDVETLPVEEPVPDEETLPGQD